MTPTRPFAVVICGRPNVGKSSLFNAILGRRVAIVDPTAGVTRDRVMAEVRDGGRAFELVDTGGLGLFDNVQLRHEVERQISIALDGADVILFVVDARDGLLPADQEIARRLRTLDKPVILVANKCDGIKIEREAAAFYRLGFGEPVLVSALVRQGIADLKDALFERASAGSPAAASEADVITPSAARDSEETPDGELDDADGGAEDQGLEGTVEGEARPPDRPIKLAIVGKVNSGKSTLMNLLVGSERVIVSDIPGTTRDAVDAPFERIGRRFIAIDTAGLQKRRVVEGTADFYGQSRAVSAIDRCDVVLLLVDATRDVSQIDKSIAAAVERAARPVVIVVTKWDLARQDGRQPDEYAPYLRQQLPRLAFSPVCFISSFENLNVDETLEVALDLFRQASYRAGTGPLNRAIEHAERERLPRSGRSKLPKIYYATQTGVRPPTIVVFVNDISVFGDEYRRYLGNRLRETFEFKEVPLRIRFREKKKSGAR